MGRGAIVIGLAAVIISEVIFGKFCAEPEKQPFAFYTWSNFYQTIIYYIVITGIVAEDAF